MKESILCLLLVASELALPRVAEAADSVPLRQRLQASPFQIAYETYVNDNWEIFVMAADGSHPTNLTQTPTLHEHYPQVSPDGKRICFVADEGEGRDAVRSLWVMDADGGHRKKLVDHAREPFWHPDSQTIGYLPQEYPKFDVIDFYTTGMSFYNLATGKITPHSNSAALHHLYNPSFAPNGKWIAATVHGGMGFSHAILLIEAHGNKIINLNIPGCRPCLSPDGRSLAWGSDDHHLAVAPINLEAENPTVGERRLTLQDTRNHIYHIDWSPDSRFLSFSRGPQGHNNPVKPGTFGADYAAIVGVYAPGWNLAAVAADCQGKLDLDAATAADFVMLTTNGLSNKEPAWFRPAPSPRE
jgi:Tol biopolymer transport system component